MGGSESSSTDAATAATAATATTATTTSSETATAATAAAATPSATNTTGAAAKSGETGKKSGKGKKGAKAEAATAEKVAIATSETIYNRIRWDPSMSPAEWVIGYEDRFKGMMEVAFPDFRASDDEFIPWHRVWYFKQRGVVMWDRDKRIDLVSRTKA